VQEYGARGQLERALLFASLIRWDATRHKMLRELAREIGRADTAPPVGEPELLRLIVERINGRAGSCDR